MNVKDYRKSRYAQHADAVMPLVVQAILRMLQNDEGRLQQAVYNLVREHSLIQDAYHVVVAQSTPYAKYVYDATYAPLGLERPERVAQAKANRAFLEEQRNILEEIIQIMSELYIEVADEDTNELLRDRFDTFIGKIVRIQTAMKVDGRLTSKFRNLLKTEFLAAVGDA